VYVNCLEKHLFINKGIEMKCITKLAVFCFSVFLSTSVFAKECDSLCQLDQVETYFSALDKVARKGSTMSDIDTLLALMHDDVKYIHVQYDANFNKETWRKAFLRNLKKGRYQNTDSNEIRILNSIAGHNHIAVEYSHGLKKQDGKWLPTDKYLVLFGFTEGKMSLIKELW
jgi:hypothetical protein